MTRAEKNELIDDLADRLTNHQVIYLTDISAMDAETTSKLRRLCFSRNVRLQMVKNTLLRKAMERVADKDFGELPVSLKGNTSLMIADTGNVPAKLIKEFRKKQEKPILKGAYIEEAIFIGDDQLEALSNLKSKEELVGDIIALLQSPAKNVISALQSGGQTLVGVLETLSEKSE